MRTDRSGLRTASCHPPPSILPVMPSSSSDLESRNVDARAPGESVGRERSSRLSVRLPGPQKSLIDQAAELSGLTTTAFVVSTLVEKARAVVVDAWLATLSDTERDSVLAALDDGESTDALTRALTAHERPVTSTSAVAYAAPSTTEPAADTAGPAPASMEAARAESQTVETPQLESDAQGLASQPGGQA